jgi:dihydrofolate reductase
MHAIFAATSPRTSAQIVTDATGDEFRQGWLSIHVGCPIKPEEAVMGEVVVSMFVTLDGVMQSPGMPEEDRDSGFEHGGWQVPYFDDETGQVMVEDISRFDALLLGRRTYEIFATYWPHVSDDDPIAAKLNRAPKYLASRSLHTAEWQNTTILGGEIADEVARLKLEYDEIAVSGSGNLVQTLLREDLVDRLSLWIYPVLLGSGKRLFADGTVPAALRLVDSTTYGNGAVRLIYERLGKPTYGTTALDADRPE